MTTHKDGNEMVVFWRKLGRLIGAGIPFLQALDTAGGEAGDERILTLARSASETVRGGGTFADALASHPVLVSEAVLLLVRAGEATGTLDRTCLQIADGLAEGSFSPSSQGEGQEAALAADSAPVVAYISKLITQASDARASDIHLEPTREGMRCRFRVDGTLRSVELPLPDGAGREAVVTRIKIMCGMDVAERQLPQDGRIVVNVNGRNLDLRVSTAGAVNGETVVMRILLPENVLVSLEHQGLVDEKRETVLGWLKRPSGIIIVSGPTGSGKTTTLYSLTEHLDKERRKIMSIEEPVEYDLPGVIQLPVRSAKGLTFPQLMRTVMRQDPDVIFVGEIRDLETARMCVQAALTGHLIITTMHTDSAPEALRRLVDVGVEPWLVASCVIGAINQRLVRKVCPACARPAELSGPAAQAASGMAGTYMEGEGCESCNGGYRGRTAIHEVLVPSDAVWDALGHGEGRHAIRAAAEASGMVTLRQDGLVAAARGETTVAEVLRVTAGVPTV